MAKYDGKNKTNSSLKTAIDRAQFRSDRMQEEEKVMKDFTLFENHHYGRIDNKMNVIYVRQEKLKSLPSSANSAPLYAADFVVDAFEKVRSRFLASSALGKIPRDLRFLSEIKPVTAYQDPVELYSRHIGALLEVFNNSFLKDRVVLDFDQYYSFFLQYVDTMKTEFPMTFTCFQRSKYSNIFTTGLAISIADLPIDEDQNKEDHFINTSCYNFYKNVCLNNGFYISKNSPWVLVANILSPSLLLYTKKYNLSTKKQIFFSHYNDCINIDINILLNNLLVYYNIFYNNKRYYKSLSICGSKTVSKITNIKPLDVNYVNNRYTEYYMLNLYIKIRNIEEYSPFNPSQLREIIKKSKTYYKLLDKSKGIDYIVSTFRKTYKNRPGGLNDFIKGLNRRTNDIPDTR